MHQSQFLREQRNRYLHKLAILNQLADVTGISVPQLISHIDRLRHSNKSQEALRIESPTARGDVLDRS